MNKKRRKFQNILYVLFVLIFLIGAINLGRYYLDAYHSKQASDNLAKNVIIWDDAEDKKESLTEQDTHEDELDEEETNIPERVDFDSLLEENKDVVAWLYCPDTVINYPVVQGDDNNTYIRSNLKKEHSNEGTLFVEAANASDFSDFNTIIFGHNMKSGAMFHTITQYADQDFYDEHPTMYLYTPKNRYEIKLKAGCVVASDSPIYKVTQPSEQKTVVEGMMKKSTFATDDKDITDTGNYLTLSTCSYEYEGARFVLVGELVEW